MPDPPYYAVIFTSQRTPSDDGYEALAERMLELASQQPGFLGVDAVRDASGRGMTASYWTDLESIRRWRNQAQHRMAQALGRSGWYSEYEIRICRVEEVRRFHAAE
ncbi:MAG: antibiotic biosynthesis monooxygenase [Planctomyces sp.]|nr:antibiotic biosynthesis monooxygenase [Planctomyces sp.]